MYADVIPGKYLIFRSVSSFQGCRFMQGLVAQLVRAPPCHGGGRGFESRLGRYGILAQLGEHLPYKQRVIGSSPIGPSNIIIIMDGFPSGQRGQTVNLLAMPSMVRIHLPPLNKKHRIDVMCQFDVFC